MALKDTPGHEILQSKLTEQPIVIGSNTQLSPKKAEPNQPSDFRRITQSSLASRPQDLTPVAAPQKKSAGGRLPPVEFPDRAQRQVAPVPTGAIRQSSLSYPAEPIVIQKHERAGFPNPQPIDSQRITQSSFAREAVKPIESRTAGFVGKVQTISPSQDDSALALNKLLRMVANSEYASPQKGVSAPLLISEL